MWQCSGNKKMAENGHLKKLSRIFGGLPLSRRIISNLWHFDDLIGRDQHT